MKHFSKLSWVVTFIEDFRYFSEYFTCINLFNFQQQLYGIDCVIFPLNKESEAQRISKCAPDHRDSKGDRIWTQACVQPLPWYTVSCVSGSAGLKVTVDECGCKLWSESLNWQSGSQLFDLHIFVTVIRRKDGFIDFLSHADVDLCVFSTSYMHSICAPPQCGGVAMWC